MEIENSGGVKGGGERKRHEDANRIARDEGARRGFGVGDRGGRDAGDLGDEAVVFCAGDVDGRRRGPDGGVGFFLEPCRDVVMD